MDQERQDRGARRVAALFLARADGAFDDRVHHLEMRRVECQNHVDVAARRAQVRRKPL